MLVAKGGVKLRVDSPMQPISILETLNETSESPLSKEPEESLEKSTEKATPVVPIPSVAVSSPTSVEASESKIILKEKPSVAAVSDKPNGKPQETEASAAAGVDSTTSDTALDAVKKRAMSAEKKKLRRIRTNSQVETII